MLASILPRSRIRCHSCRQARHYGSRLDRLQTLRRTSYGHSGYIQPMAIRERSSARCGRQARIPSPPTPECRTVEGGMESNGKRSHEKRVLRGAATVSQTAAPKKQRTALEPNLSQELWKFL